jgi:hypothetical protein
VSQVVSSSCIAALPTRTGGLDQIAANRTSAGTSSGRTARTLARPADAALASVSATARSFTSTAHTVAPGARVARVRAIGP